MPDRSAKIINRDVSWLSFNDRVLQEAADTNVPLLERVKFLGIVSSNLDEFYRVRVATLKRMADLEDAPKAMLGDKPGRILHQIYELVLDQRHRSDHIYETVLHEMAAGGVFIINETQLSARQGKFVEHYFHEKVHPTLVPIMVDALAGFPPLKDKAIYLGIRLNTGRKHRHALIELPTDILPRFLVLPSAGEQTHIMLLDDVIRYNLRKIFSIFEMDSIEAYTIKLTRDAELDLDDDISDSVLLKISKSLKQRKKGRPVRFIYDEQMPVEMLRLFIRRMKLHKNDNLIPGARYHNFKDFIRFPHVGRHAWLNPEREPLIQPDIEGRNSLFSIVRKKDILLHFPYQEFHHLIDLLREAAIDPQVTSIRMTLYRVAEHSNVANALINAVKNGKQVTVVVELQARFDEENNIFWANRLREEGARVIFGVAGLKVHAKLCLINRKERNSTVRYAYIGTGNFNESTALLYSDHGLLTANKSLTEEVAAVFQYFDNNLRIGNFRHLLVSPLFMRSGMTALIDQEILHARAGRKAYMVLKMNSLVDPGMIMKLYEASQEGVRIQLIIRGICSLKAGVKGLSENIQAYSIVDKYLEHSRIFLFGNNGDEKIYISSADWMTRNLDHRVEVAAPIYDKELRSQLRAFLGIQLSDNIKARILNARQVNHYRPAAVGETPLRAQDAFYDLLQRAATEGPSVFEQVPLRIAELPPLIGVQKVKPAKRKRKK